MRSEISNPNPEVPINACLADLPAGELNKRRYSIYVIDYNWTYLFANDYAKTRLGGVSIEGKNIEQIWKELPHLNFQPIYDLLRDSVASKSPITVRSTSPLTNKTIDIRGLAMSECYYFSVVELPDKDSLISELKSYLKNRDGSAS